MCPLASASREPSAHGHVTSPGLDCVRMEFSGVNWQLCSGLELATLTECVYFSHQTLRIDEFDFPDDI